MWKEYFAGVVGVMPIGMQVIVKNSNFKDIENKSRRVKRKLSD